MKKTSSQKSLDSYINPDCYSENTFSKYYIDREYLKDSLNIRGKIYVFEEKNYDLSWANTVNKLAKTKEKIIKKRPGKVKSVILLEIENRIFALSFSNGISLVKSEFIENSFGIKTNRKIIDNEKLKSIKSVSLSEGVISNHRYASKSIPSQYQLDNAPLSVVNNIKGSVQNMIINGFKITVSGQNQIQLKASGETDFLQELVVVLKKLLNIYLDEHTYKDNFYWDNEIKREKDTDKVNKLNKKLANKIKKMVERVEFSSTNQVTRKTLSNIQLYPDIPYLEENPVLGFNVSGIGYPGTTVLEKLDEVQIFSQLAIFLKNKNGKEWSIEKIISKLKTDKVYYFLEDSTPIYLSNVYNSIYFQTSLVGEKKSKYILFQGKWYEVPIDFYDRIERKINSIDCDSLGIKYIDFTNEHSETRKDKTVVSSEAAYNKAMSNHPGMVLFDSKNYPISSEKITKYRLAPGSQIEPCDILNYNDGKLQFIHVKKGRSGSGISHLLNQAYVSSILYEKDPAFPTHLNKEIVTQGKESINFKAIDKKDIVIVLVCIVEPDYVGKYNSQTFPLLTAVSIVRTVSEIRDLGFECRLVKVPNKYEKKR